MCEVYSLVYEMVYFGYERYNFGIDQLFSSNLSCWGDPVTLKIMPFF